MKILSTLAILFILSAMGFAEEPRLGWERGMLERVGAAIGGETTGWRLGEFDVEGDAAVLDPLEGRRVAIFGEHTTKEWVERGPKPLLKAVEVVGLEKPELDLTLRGKVEVEEQTKAPVYVAMLLIEDRKPDGASAVYVVSAVKEDGTYELVVPAILGRKGWSYRIHAWVDENGNGLCDEGDRPGPPERTADDPHSISFADGGWVGNGLGPIRYKSPSTMDFRIGK